MLIIADNLHVVRSDIARAVADMNPEPIRRLVHSCLRAGAQAIDVNSGPLPRKARERMRLLVDAVRSVHRGSLLLDTTNADAMAAGLAACRGKAIVNGFSLEPDRIERFLPLAKSFGADIIGYLLYPGGRVPVDADDLMQAAVSLFEICIAAGLPPERLIIDPVIAPLSWQDGLRHNQSVLTLLRHLPDLLGAPVRTIAGLSNLASGPMPLERKIALEQAYLPMLAAAGLDMLLVNVWHKPTIETANLSDGLLGSGVFAWGDVAPGPAPHPEGAMAMSIEHEKER
ncbi:MAG: dihydropteroate synthase [Desulfatitalea sp.]|nr:dihydropteroate synthase [Desulfatitalea sp.]NNK01629.1 dihydropteroate synthase [Desulfatitalea sp.]